MGSAVIREVKKRQDYEIVSVSRRGKVGGDGDDVTWVLNMYLHIYIYIAANSLTFTTC